MTQDSVPVLRGRDYLLLTAVLGALLPLELMAARWAYETLGEIDSALYFAAMVLNVLFVGIFFKYPRVAVGGMCALGLAIVPYQTLLVHRLVRVQSEANRIIDHAYKALRKQGTFPADLSDYAYNDSEMKNFVQSYRVDRRGDFVLLYRVGTVSTSHWYSSHTGWGYYPD